MCNERVCERAKEREGTYITSAETAQLSILFRVSAGFTTSSLWGRGCCLSAGANPDLHTCSIFPSSSSSYGWTLGASFMLLPPPSLKLLNLKKKKVCKQEGPYAAWSLGIHKIITMWTSYADMVTFTYKYLSLYWVKNLYELKDMLCWFCSK